MPKPDWITARLVYEGLKDFQVPIGKIWDIIKDMNTQDLGKLIRAVKRALRIP